MVGVEKTRGQGEGVSSQGLDHQEPCKAFSVSGTK